METKLQYSSNTFFYNMLLAYDGYKASHKFMFPDFTTRVYSNYTCRSTKRMHDRAKRIVVMGTQLTMKYIHDLFENNFFSIPKDVVISEAKQYLDSYLNCDYDMTHFEELHDLGYLPIKVKALKEGTVINEKVPMLTIINTLDNFYWVTNFLESIISCTLWKPVHTASIAYGFKKVFTRGALRTDKENLGFVNFQGHDFSMRGMQSFESAAHSGVAFLSSFLGTDTVASLQLADYYYFTKNAAFSVPASEHAVMAAHGKESEIHTLEFLMKKFPTGFLSVVSDTWDFWKLVGEYLPKLKVRILERDGKIVIRPDSGNSVDIIAGMVYSKDIYEAFRTDVHYFENNALYKINNEYDEIKGNYILSKGELITNNINEIKGLIETLYDIFGGTITKEGYKKLDSHIGAILGDGVTFNKVDEIIKRLIAKKFATTNIVFGIGSYCLGYATRDEQGGAIKATFCVVDGEEREIFKDPLTDIGKTKKSAKGLIMVFRGEDGELDYKDQCSWDEEQSGELELLYENGKFYNLQSLTQIRERVDFELMIDMEKENFK